MEAPVSVEDRSEEKLRFSLGMLVVGVVLFFVVIALVSEGRKAHAPFAGGWSMSVPDGEVRLASDGTAQVSRRDGTTRQATEEERLEVMTLAAQVGSRR